MRNLRTRTLRNVGTAAFLAGSMATLPAITGTGCLSTADPVESAAAGVGEATYESVQAEASEETTRQTGVVRWTFASWVAPDYRQEQVGQYLGLDADGKTVLDVAYWMYGAKLEAQAAEPEPQTGALDVTINGRPWTDEERLTIFPLIQRDFENAAPQVPYAHPDCDDAQVAVVVALLAFAAATAGVAFGCFPSPFSWLTCAPALIIYAAALAAFEVTVVRRNCCLGDTAYGAECHKPGEGGGSGSGSGHRKKAEER